MCEAFESTDLYVKPVLILCEEWLAANLPDVKIIIDPSNGDFKLVLDEMAPQQPVPAITLLETPEPRQPEPVVQTINIQTLSVEASSGISGGGSSTDDDDIFEEYDRGYNRRRRYGHKVDKVVIR